MSKNAWKHARCQACGDDFSYLAKRAQKGGRPPGVCPSCTLDAVAAREVRQEQAQHAGRHVELRCPDCGEPFLHLLASRGRYPLRCESCRIKAARVQGTLSRSATRYQLQARAGELARELAAHRAAMAVLADGLARAVEAANLLDALSG